jgi:hypothetical protein
MGVFSGGYSETTGWDPSYSPLSNITYECRFVGYGSPPLSCGAFSPPFNMTYDIEYSNDSGVNWLGNVLANYSGCPDGCYGSWNLTTFFFDPSVFPDSSTLRLRIRAYDGYAYSGWTESLDVTNCKSNWNCVEENLSECYGDGYFTCINATDVSGCGYNASDYPELYVYNQRIILNRTSCCTPDWQCNLFTACQSTYQSCLNVQDNNNCNQTYTGNYSEFGLSRCQISIPYDQSYPWWNTSWTTRNRISFENPTNETVKTMFYPNPNRYTCAFSDLRDLRLVGLDNSSGVVFYNTESIPDFNFTQFQIDVSPGFSGLWGYVYCDNPSAVSEGASCPLCVDFNWTYTSDMNLSWISEVYTVGPRIGNYVVGDIPLMFIDWIATVPAQFVGMGLLSLTMLMVNILILGTLLISGIKLAIQKIEGKK